MNIVDDVIFVNYSLKEKLKAKAQLRFMKYDSNVKIDFENEEDNLMTNNFKKILHNYKSAGKSKNEVIDIITSQVEIYNINLPVVKMVYKYWSE